MRATFGNPFRQPILVPHQCSGFERGDDGGEGVAEGDNKISVSATCQVIGIAKAVIVPFLLDEDYVTV